MQKSPPKINSTPAGLVVHPGAGNSDHTLLNALLHHKQDLQHLPRAGIIHRLDKNTSGLLMIAKTPLAYKQLCLQLKKRTITREYQAIVVGQLISGGTIDLPIGRHPMLRTRMAVVDGGKSAITHFRIAEKYQAYTRLHIHLETGRTHQIRVHMAQIHHPIVGDSTYGKRCILTRHMPLPLIEAMHQFNRQALHACALKLRHPVTQNEMQFTAECPIDMLHLMSLLRNNGKEKFNEIHSA